MAAEAEPAAAAPAAAPAAPPPPVAPPPPPPPRPAYVIAGALVRASIGKIVGFLIGTGSGYVLLRFGIKPGPASIAVNWKMAEAFGVTEAERAELGITPDTSAADGSIIKGGVYEFQYSDVATEAVALEIRRLGWEGDLRIHPLLVLGGVVIATPITQWLRSPGAADEAPRRRAAREPAEDTDYDR